MLKIQCFRLYDTRAQDVASSCNSSIMYHHKLKYSHNWKSLIQDLLSLQTKLFGKQNCIRLPQVMGVVEHHSPWPRTNTRMCPINERAGSQESITPHSNKTTIGGATKRKQRKWHKIVKSVHMPKLSEIEVYVNKCMYVLVPDTQVFIGPSVPVDPVHFQHVPITQFYSHLFVVHSRCVFLPSHCSYTDRRDFKTSCLNKGLLRIKWGLQE